jgi:hypothetical protein
MTLLNLCIITFLEQNNGGQIIIIVFKNDHLYKNFT